MPASGKSPELGVQFITTDSLSLPLSPCLSSHRLLTPNSSPTRQAGITTYSYGVCVLGIHLDTNAKFVGYCFVLSIATLCAKACQIPTNYSKDSSDRKPSGGHFLVQLVFPAVEYTLLGIIAMT